MTKNIPLSEDAAKFQADWDRAACIAELKRIAEAEPERVVTRNYFRNHAQCSEATWNRYFGTFTEFKSAAGITLSRGARRLELEIARHASIDKRREMNAERHGYAGRYLKPRRRKIKTTVIASDLHDVNCDPFFWRVLVDAVRRIAPDKIVLGGDTFDLPEFGKYTVDPRTWDPVARFRDVHKRLGALREASPDSEIDMIEGNHEHRLLGLLCEATPALVTILGDLHGMTIPRLFGLDDYEVNYHAAADLAVFSSSDVRREIRKNFLVCWDALLVHHFPAGREMGIPGCHGHHHHHLVTRHYSQRYGASEWHQLGCGHVRAASYCDAQKWNNGFLVCHTDVETLRTNFEYVEVRDIAVVGGEYYFRRKSERP